MGLTSASTNPLAVVAAGSALGGSSKKLNKKRAQSQIKSQLAMIAPLNFHEEPPLS